MSKIIDMTGWKMSEHGVLDSKWLVLERDLSNLKRTFWICQCECGEIKSVEGNSLRTGKSKQCLRCSNTKNLTGQKFGKLTVLKKDMSSLGNKSGCSWVCSCDCGNIITVLGKSLKTKDKTSCGKCVSTKEEDLTGQKFGKLTVLQKAKKENVKNTYGYWLCECECGNKKIIMGRALKKGQKSCGCERSKGELKIENILKQNKIMFIREKIFNSCILPSGYHARFDFYLPEYNTIIEYDGEQHYNDWGFGDLKQTQKRDSIKNQWCFNNNIPLIRIPYWHLDKLCLEDLLLETSSFIVRKPIEVTSD